MQEDDDNERKHYQATLENFLKSDDFRRGVISSTKASWSGESYKVELMPDGRWYLVWSNQIGNLYETPGIILTLPQLDYDPSDKDEYEESGAGDEDDFFDAQFGLEFYELEAYLRDALGDALEIDEFDE